MFSYGPEKIQGTAGLELGADSFPAPELCPPLPPCDLSLPEQGLSLCHQGEMRSPGIDGDLGAPMGALSPPLSSLGGCFLQHLLIH